MDILVDFLVTIIRLPLGVVAGVVSLVFWLVCFVAETVFAIIALPLYAIIGSRKQVKTSWLSTYPNSAPITNTLIAWGKIARWVLND